MANKKITDLTEATSFSGDTDLIPIVTNVGGTPLNQKITKANFESGMSGLQSTLVSGTNIKTINSKK